MSAIVFVLDGETVRADAVDPNTTLLHWLRANRKTGTKEGCAEGECGACAVAWRANGPDGRARWEVVNSCLVLLPSVHGRELVTSEGLASADGALHPAQRCMAEGGGSQCGYCTPGFVVSLFGEMYRGEDGPFDPECIAGNLCRCTGYRPIREASEKLAQLRTRSRGAPDRFRDQLATPVPPLPAIEHASASPITGGAPRQFARPSSLHDAVALLGREPHRTIVNGGTDVTVEVNQRHKRHDAYLSLEGVPELSVFEERDDMLVIGAGVSLASIEERLHHRAIPGSQGDLPMLRELLPLFSSRLIRTRATFGGNLGTASPIGDGPPALLAIDAEVVLASHDAHADAINRRIVPLSGYFLGYRKTARAPYELIEAIRIPRPFYATQRFYKVSKRKLDDISSVAGAFALDRDEDGRVTRARIAFGGVAATPIRLPEIEARLLDRHVTPHELEPLARLASESVTPIDDHRASARYRKAMVASLLRKLAFDLADTTRNVEVSP